VNRLDQIDSLAALLSETEHALDRVADDVLSLAEDDPTPTRTALLGEVQDLARRAKALRTAINDAATRG
jgi:hypothetical protein